jgi:hypothetical protein
LELEFVVALLLLPELPDELLLLFTVPALFLDGAVLLLPLPL